MQQIDGKNPEPPFALIVTDEQAQRGVGGEGMPSIANAHLAGRERWGCHICVSPLPGIFILCSWQAK